jgi:hypothetical protein
VEVSRRLTAWISREFPEGTADQVLATLRDLPPEDVFWQGDTERLAAAIVLPCRGRWDWFQAQVELVRIDWRDVLVNGGVANSDWPKVLKQRLGSAR